MPHAGSATVETRREMARMVVEDVRRVLSGREAPAGAAARRGEKMTKVAKHKSSFSSLDAAADRPAPADGARGQRARLAAGRAGAASWASRCRARSSRSSLVGRRLTVSLLDPSWKRPVEATLAELEAKLAIEMPEIRPRVTLR